MGAVDFFCIDRSVERTGLVGSAKVVLIAALYWRRMIFQARSAMPVMHDWRWAERRIGLDLASLFQIDGDWPWGGIIDKTFDLGPGAEREPWLMKVG
jgi:hypothetical protein